jgi:hypothetical protein
VKEMMGHEYMHMHSIGYGPSVQLDDAKTALRAYWRLAEQRFHSNATAAIEQVLLLKGSQHIERVLLELVNNDWAAGNSSGGGDAVSPYGSFSLAEIMAEDPAVIKERNALFSAKHKYEGALKRMAAVVSLRMK